MLPMSYAPKNEEVTTPEFSSPYLSPSDREIWTKVLPIALTFWKKVEAEETISKEIRSVSKDWIGWLLSVMN